jgi:hypothetical protein
MSHDHRILTDDPDESVANLLAILHRGFPNLLLIGDDAALESAFRRIQPYLRIAIAPCVSDITSIVPATTVGTLIVKDVRHLDGGQQAALTALIGAVPDIQVVSMARAPVYPLIEAGGFLEDLYYRLNCVTLDLTASKQSATCVANGV